jgi:hypothetical protein
MRLTKKALVHLAGSQEALAALLGISSAAISQWGEFPPDGRDWQLQALRPEWFSAESGKPALDESRSTASDLNGAMTMPLEVQGNP